MARAFLTLLCLALAACASDEPEPVPVRQAPAAPAPAQTNGIVYTMAKPEAQARSFVEEVAARCWLDAELQAAAVIVDRQTGRIVVVGETEALVVADFAAADDTSTDIALTGPAIEDTARATRLVLRLNQAEASGNTAC